MGSYLPMDRFSFLTICPEQTSCGLLLAISKYCENWNIGSLHTKLPHIWRNHTGLCSHNGETVTTKWRCFKSLWNSLCQVSDFQNFVLITFKLANQFFSPHFVAIYPCLKPVSTSTPKLSNSNLFTKNMWLLFYICRNYYCLVHEGVQVKQV